MCHARAGHYIQVAPDIHIGRGLGIDDRMFCHVLQDIHIPESATGSHSINITESIAHEIHIRAVNDQGIGIVAEGPVAVDPDLVIHRCIGVK